MKSKRHYFKFVKELLKNNEYSYKDFWKNFDCYSDSRIIDDIFSEMIEDLSFVSLNDVWDNYWNEVRYYCRKLECEIVIDYDYKIHHINNFNTLYNELQYFENKIEHINKLIK